MDDRLQSNDGQMSHHAQHLGDAMREELFFCPEFYFLGLFLSHLTLATRRDGHVAA